MVIKLDFIDRVLTDLFSLTDSCIFQCDSLDVNR